MSKVLILMWKTYINLIFLEINIINLKYKPIVFKEDLSTVLHNLGWYDQLSFHKFYFL